MFALQESWSNALLDLSQMHYWEPPPAYSAQTDSSQHRGASVPNAKKAPGLMNIGQNASRVLLDYSTMKKARNVKTVHTHFIVPKEFEKLVEKASSPISFLPQTLALNAQLVSTVLLRCKCVSNALQVNIRTRKADTTARFARKQARTPNLELQCALFAKLALTALIPPNNSNARVELILSESKHPAMIAP